MPGGYVIQVGNERPGEAIVAHVNKKNGEPTGPQMKRYIPVGSHLLINRARVWGRRFLMKDGKKVTDDVEFNTVGYKGEIEFMEWGKDGGYAIDIRYIPQSRSLDYEYQSNVQKIYINPDQEGAHITLKSGENKFDTKKDDLLITFLKVYPLNRDSKFKNPDPTIKSYVYYEITDEHVDQVAVRMIENSVEAATFVKNLSTKPDHIRNVFNIMGDREEFGDTNLLSGDAQIYKVLLQYASSNAEDFFYILKKYRESVEDAFSKAKSYNALDLTKDGHIALEVGGKKNLIISEVKSKGDGMIKWMLDNFYDDEVFKATQAFKDQVSKLK